MSVLEECYKSGCLTALDIVEVNLDLVAEEFRRKQVRQITHFLSDVFYCKSDQYSLLFFRPKGFGPLDQGSGLDREVSLADPAPPNPGVFLPDL